MLECWNAGLKRTEKLHLDLRLSPLFQPPIIPIFLDRLDDPLEDLFRDIKIRVNLLHIVRVLNSLHELE